VYPCCHFLCIPDYEKLCSCNCHLQKIINVENDIAFFNQSQLSYPFQRYISYYFYSDIKYTIGIYKKNDKYFSISVGKNPWKKFNSLNIGEICKRYGGGGRENVGAVLTDNEEEAKRVQKKIKEYINSKNA